jgi:phosphoribosylformylglycinamidine cyclo-ligase
MGISYRDTCEVLANQELGLEALLNQLRPTNQFREGKSSGRSVLDIGYFANVIEFAPGLGLALTTDGVGTKILIAEMLNRYDTIGIDCIAMNVNDLICVGAEPISMLDYIAIEKADARILEEIGKGLRKGAEQAGVNLVGGEISQIKELIKGIDLVGMCVGSVPLDRVNQGQNVEPGDIIVALKSSGIHCNGLTLARKVLFEKGQLKPDTYSSELGRSVGEELLIPTMIYVRPVLELLRRNLPIKAMINITSDGFLNLNRIKATVGFMITSLPEPNPIFHLIQRMGNVDDGEMYRVFNMGVGFCLIAPPDPAVINVIHDVARQNAMQSFEIGHVVKDERRRVFIPEKGLVGEGESFTKADQMSNWPA